MYCPLCSHEMDMEYINTRCLCHWCELYSISFRENGVGYTTCDEWFGFRIDHKMKYSVINSIYNDSHIESTIYTYKKTFYYDMENNKIDHYRREKVASITGVRIPPTNNINKIKKYIVFS